MSGVWTTKLVSPSMHRWVKHDRTGVAAIVEWREHASDNMHGQHWEYFLDGWCRFPDGFDERVSAVDEHLAYVDLMSAMHGGESD